jgi:chloride channel 7
LTGLLTGLVAIVLVAATEAITHGRSTFVDHQWRRQGHNNRMSIFVAYAATNLGLALVSAALCLIWAPAAVGSGIPEVKAYLNGVRVLRFSRARLFLVKILGTILSVSSGLAIGPEGPLVHMGAILGASCTKISNLLLWMFPHSSSTSRLWTFLTMDLAHFATDAERRDLVSIGAAAGFAAGTCVCGIVIKAPCVGFTLH